MGASLGTSALGLASLGAGPLHDPPTVSVSTPTGTVSSGGPGVSVAWLYTQAQNDTQAQYRIVVKKTGTVQYDTGWLLGSSSVHIVDWDANEIDGDGAFTADVYVRGPDAIGAGGVARYEAFDTTSFTMAFGSPELTITAPADSSIHLDPDSVDVSWTFVDAGHTQSAYRVALASVETEEELYSTGWVTSTDQTVQIPYTFADNTAIRVKVQNKNENGMRST